ncbi:urease accessory protein UreD [Halalkalibacter sp. AB-rgal2]|uniref:urease accessory protein UreD n=1 Tax=Halalkalibacter sp. AB-rgal2 TaxID=3242695 RepID=UPI00359F089E
MKRTGTLEVTATKREQKSILSDVYYEGAMKITRPVYLEEDVPTIYMIDIGGGYVDGDTYATTLHVEQGAHLAVTSQASAKIYKTPKTPVKQVTRITLEGNSVIEYVPDALIAYKNSRFQQETVVEMEPNSCLIYSDSMTPGWAEDGSYFKYDWIRSKLKIIQNGKLVVYDHLLLHPDGEMSGILQMDGYSHVGMFMIVHEQVNSEWIDRLYEELVQLNSPARFGLSALPVKGVIIRILANQTMVIEKLIKVAHSFSRKELFGREYAAWRKY